VKIVGLGGGGQLGGRGWDLHVVWRGLGEDSGVWLVSEDLGLSVVSGVVTTGW